MFDMPALSLTWYRFAGVRQTRPDAPHIKLLVSKYESYQLVLQNADRISGGDDSNVRLATFDLSFGHFSRQCRYSATPIPTLENVDELLAFHDRYGGGWAQQKSRIAGELQRHALASVERNLVLL